MSLHIYLTRHGQNEDNANGILNGHRDLPLTDLGEQQAESLAEYIKSTGIYFDKIYSSPLQRTYKTAKTITDVLGIQAPEKLDILIERDFGIMTGKLQKDIEILCAPDIIKVGDSIYFLSPEGAETFPQLLERGKKIIEYITSQHSDGNILLVAHGDIGKMIYAAYYNLDRETVLKAFHFGNTDLVLLSEKIKPEDAHIFITKQYNT